MNAIRREELRQFIGEPIYHNTPHFVIHSSGVSTGVINWNSGTVEALGETTEAPSISGSDILLPDGIWSGTLKVVAITDGTDFRTRHRFTIIADPDLESKDPLLSAPHDIPVAGPYQVGFLQEDVRVSLEIPPLLSKGDMGLRIKQETVIGGATLVTTADTVLTLQKMTPAGFVVPSPVAQVGPAWYSMETGLKVPGYVDTPDHYPDVYPVEYTTDTPELVRGPGPGIHLRGSTIIPQGTPLPYNIFGPPPSNGQPNPTPASNKTWPGKRFWRDADNDGFADTAEFSDLEWHTDGSWWLTATDDWSGLTELAHEYWSWWSAVFLFS